MPGRGFGVLATEDEEKGPDALRACPVKARAGPIARGRKVAAM